MLVVDGIIKREWGIYGRFEHKIDNSDSPLTRIIDEAVLSEINWEPLYAGLFNSDSKNFLQRQLILLKNLISYNKLNIEDV